MKKYKFYHFLFIIEKIVCRLSNKLSRMIEKILYIEIKKELTPLFKQAEKKIVQEEKTSNDIAWILWWQGLNNSPEIVKSCITSVIKRYDGNVIVITKDNVKKYTNISDIIYDKFSKGFISKTHFSDIVRFNLLRNHGGLWIDATIFCSKKFFADDFKEFYTSKGRGQSFPYFMDGKWTGFLIGGQKNDLTFQFMDEFFKIYWNENNYLINYFLIDYALKYSYDMKIGSLYKYVDDKAMYNNPELFNLTSYLNHRFENDIYDSLIKKTTFFKLTYKKKFKESRNSFYDVLIKGNNKK